MSDGNVCLSLKMQALLHCWCSAIPFVEGCAKRSRLRRGHPSPATASDAPPSTAHMRWLGLTVSLQLSPGLKNPPLISLHGRARFPHPFPHPTLFHTVRLNNCPPRCRIHPATRESSTLCQRVSASEWTPSHSPTSKSAPSCPTGT